MTSKREIHLAIRSLATQGKTLSVGHGGEVTDRGDKGTKMFFQEAIKYEM